MSQYNFSTQSLNLPSIYNCRELGGYVLPDGRTVKRGLLLRGGSFYTASRQDLDTLRDKYHLAVNFDFRTEGEVRHMPDAEIEGVKRIWLPTIDPETENVVELSLPKEAFADLNNYLVNNSYNPLVQSIASRLYTDMVANEYTQLQYAVFLQTLVNVKDGAVYWHCSQGKDRTGLGAAFLLGALGADRKLIMEDYEISAEYYLEEYNRVAAMVKTREEKEVIQTFLTVRPPIFTAALDWIDRRYGSLEGYLRGPLCLSDDDFAVLKERYTQ